MRTFDIESNSGKIIYALGMGVGITVGLSNKRTSYKLSKMLLKEIFGINKKPKNISVYFSRLRNQKLIEVKYKKGEDILELTEDGRNIFLRFNYEKIELKKSKIWDRCFRVIVFDIPERKRVARDSLRDKIKELGFLRFNHSVWVYPYPCQNEIDFIANYWDIGKYVHFMLVKDLTSREKVEKYFNL